jgi:hypothetical protein
MGILFDQVKQHQEPMSFNEARTVVLMKDTVSPLLIDNGEDLFGGTIPSTSWSSLEQSWISFLLCTRRTPCRPSRSGTRVARPFVPSLNGLGSSMAAT